MADDVPLAFYQPAGLFLKPEAKAFIEVKLPEIKVSGVSISNWEVMEKIKALSKPEEFLSLRVVNYSREIIQFEGEFDSLRAMRKVILLLNGKSMKLSGFTELMKVKAKRSEPPYPTKREWEDYFVERGVSTFDEGKPGEKPDTIRIMGLPVKWFTSKHSEEKPCPRVLTQAFQKFGKVRQVGIYDPSSSSQQHGSFSAFGPGAGVRFLHFEAYIQYEKYSAFCNALNSLKYMKILRLEDGGRESVANIKVDFDRTGFLSERSIRKRRHAEERREKELEEIKQKEEEEKRMEEARREEELRAKEEIRAQKRARRTEERRRKKRQQAALVAKLKAIAMQRREEAQRLLSVLLAGAAEARYGKYFYCLVILCLMLCHVLPHSWLSRDLDVIRQKRIVRAGGFLVVITQWQSTGYTSQMSCVRFLVTAGLLTFLYFAS